jgi:ribonuclease HII
MALSAAPTMKEELKLRRMGYVHIAGIDEAGRGALAGPVVAAAVIFPPRLRGDWKEDVRDSKLLPAEKREYLFDHIHEKALAVGVGVVSHRVIDEIGILPATKMAMKQAITGLRVTPQTLLLDYVTLPDVPLPQKGIVDGDRLCFSIACASIVAKVSRDRVMQAMEHFFGGYGLSQHKGYATEGHIEVLLEKGPCSIHRRSFHPVLGLTFCRR